METTIACWAYIGIMEKKLEATIVYRDNGKETGNYNSLQALNSLQHFRI